MSRGIITSIAFATAVAGSLYLASVFGPGCYRPAAAADEDAPASPLRTVRATTAPERDGVKVASIRFAGFEIGKVVLVDDRAPVAPEAVKPCGL